MIVINSAILDSVRGQSSVGSIQKEGVHIIYVSVCYVRVHKRGVIYMHEGHSLNINIYIIFKL